MLEEWLRVEVATPSPYVFSLVNVIENQPSNATVKEFLGKETITAYRKLEYLKFRYKEEPKEKLVKYINENVVASNKNQITKNVWQGDFGEILASLVVSYFFGFIVPIHKLRWKFNKDRSTFCTDLIAHNSGDTIKDIFYYEVKTRLVIRKETVNHVSNHITINAHNSLLKDEENPNEGIADFLSRYYFELGDFDKASKYGDIVKNPGHYNRNFELFFVIEASKFKPDILDELNNLPPTLKPLAVKVVLIKDLGELITQTKKLAIDHAVSYVYG